MSALDSPPGPDATPHSGTDGPDAGTAASAGGHQRPNQRPLGYWVDDEGLLRDEGALFGFAAFEDGEDAAMLEAKLASIRHRYTLLIDAEETFCRVLKEELERRSEEQADARAKAAQCRAHVRHVDAADLDAFEPAAAHQRLRFGAAGVLGFAGAAFSGWIVYDHLRRSGLDHPELVSVAITLLGYVGPFQPLSVLHSRHDVVRGRTDHAEVWKLHASELVLPIAASVFVSLYAAPTVGVARAVAAGVLLAASFVVVGKLLTSTLTRFAVARRRGREELARTAVRREEVAHEAQEALAHDACADAHEAAREALYARMHEHEMEGARLQGEAQYKADLFLSEYRFALATMQRRRASGDGAAPRSSGPHLTVDPDDGTPLSPL